MGLLILPCFEAMWHLFEDERPNVFFFFKLPSHFLPIQQVPKASCGDHLTEGN